MDLHKFSIDQNYPRFSPCETGWIKTQESLIYQNRADTSNLNIQWFIAINYFLKSYVNDTICKKLTITTLSKNVRKMTKKPTKTKLQKSFWPKRQMHRETASIRDLPQKLHPESFEA